MNWETKVEDWERLPVTKAFKEEIREDIEDLLEALIDTGAIKRSDGSYKSKTSEDYMEIRGMIKALRGVLDMGVTDPILDPNKKGD